MEESVANTETVLLLKLKEGDEAAFTSIYNQYWYKLYFLAHKHLKSAVASEEIVQEVFIALWKKKATLEIDSLLLYLAAMTRYAVYRHLANEKRLAEKESKGFKIQGQAIGLEQEIENKQLLETIGKLSGMLPEKCRLVFLYNKLLDKPLAQVAEQLNISPKTAEAHLTKALKAIRENLGSALSVFFIL